MRVIAGELGGRRLTAPRGASTRPTSDRVREALFSALEPVAGARVLDLYAGTGALAIEALSRGAKSAVLVERARPALVVLHKNLRELRLDDRTVVLASSVEQALRPLAAHAPFELVLADPPYADLGACGRALERLVPLLAPGARVVLEHATRDPGPALAGIELVRTRVYGDTAVTFYQRG